MIGAGIRFVVVCGCAALAVHGQTPAPSTEERDALELLALLNTPIQSASKREQRAIESPQAIEVISAEQIRASGAFRLADVLRLATNVQVWDADPDRCNVTIRGVNPAGNPRTVQILVDGVAMFNIVAGPVDINGLPVPLDTIERIEIIRGPSSSLYGANAQTGVINITTKRAKEGASGSVRVGQANLGLNREQGYFAFGDKGFSFTAGVGAGSDKNLNLPMNFVGMPGLTVPQNTGSRYVQAFLRPEYDFGSGKVWVAVGVGNSGHTDLVSYSNAKPAALVPLAIFPNVSTERDLTQLGWAQIWSPTFHSEVRIGQKNYELNTAPLQPDAAFAGSPAILKALEGTDPALATHHAFYHDRVTETSVQVNWDPTATFHVVAGGDTKAITTYPNLSIGLGSQESLSASGGFLSLDWTLGQATFSAGARVANEDLGGASTSPRCSVVYKLDETSVFRAGYFTSTRSPMLQEKDTLIAPSGVVSATAIPNPALKPEKVSDLEVGYRKTWAKWSLDLTYYNLKIEDMILDENTGVVTTAGAKSWPQTQYQNSPTSDRDSGFELALTGELASGWTLGFNAATVSFKDPLFGLDQQADYSPSGQGTLWSRYRKGKFFAFGALQYLGSYTVETAYGAQTLRSTVDAATQVHANVGYEFLKGLSVSAYALNAARPVQETSNIALLNAFGLRYERREVGIQAAYRF